MGDSLKKVWAVLFFLVRSPADSHVIKVLHIHDEQICFLKENLCVITRIEERKESMSLTLTGG